MRKIHIGFISPYDAMIPLIDELKQGQTDLRIDARAGNLEKGVEAALEMEQQGVDLLISRGGTAKMIREALSLPVVDVHISGYDLLRSIMLAEGHSAEKKALVGFSNITMGAASIVSLLEIDMEVVTLSDASEVEQVLTDLKKRGFTRILGDVITFDAAAKLGLNGLLIQSGRESIVESFEEARHLFKSLQKNQQQLRVLEHLLQAWQKDVLILDESGHVLLERFSSFKKSPLPKALLAELHNELLALKQPIVRVEQDAAKPYSVTGELVEDRNGSLTVFSFDQSLFSKKLAKAIRVEQPAQLPSLVAESRAINSIRQLIEGAAIVREPVVLIGKAGTGKTTIASYLHVFHEKQGLLVQVDMDEPKIALEDIMLHDQSTVLLRFCHVPTDQTVAKAKELLQAVAEKRVQLVFSMPTYFKHLMEELELADAIKIQLPDLAQRKEDIPYLVRQFITEFHQTLGTQAVRVRGDAMQILVDYSWPGNLDELKAYVKKLAITEKDYVIEQSTVQQVPFDDHLAQTEIEFKLNQQDNLKEIERKIIEQVLREENYNQTQAARRLDVNRATLWRKLKN